MTSTVTTVADFTADTAPAATVLSAAEQEELIRTHMPLVGHLVRDMLTRIPNHIHRDDLTSAGLHALVTAARGWDPDRGIPFHRFASTRIRGAILDELRSLDWATRSVRTKARATDTTRHAPDHHAGPHADRRRAGPGARHHHDRPAPDRHRRAARHRAVAAGLHHQHRRRPGHREDPGPGGHAAAPRADRLPAPRDRLAARAAAVRDHRVLPATSARWPTSPTTSASPRAGSASCGPRRCRCSRTA